MPAPAAGKIQEVFMKKLFYHAVTVFAALPFLAAVLLTGCSPSRPASQGITFTVALSEDIQAVDPGLAWNYVDNQITNQITEGLVTFDENNNIVPLLAKSWSQTDDLTYVYDVRDDIVFSDGSKMTMDDVLFSFERNRDPEGGTYFSDFYADVESFSVNGKQFIIKLKQPSAVFKYIPATGAGRIISKAYYQKHEDDFGTASGGIVATGPFVFESWTSGWQITLKKNVNYWDKAKRDAIIIDTLIFRIFPDDTARVAALQTGAADFCANLPQDQVAVVRDSSNLTLTSVDSYSLTYLALNTKKPPMSDVNVRRAVFLALNIPEFNRNILKDAGSPGTILPFGQALYGENAAGWRQFLASAQDAASYNLDAAKALLAQSGFASGFTCDLVVHEDFLVNQRALFIQEALKALNITVNIRKMSGDEQDRYQRGDVMDENGIRLYDMIIGGWEADYPDLNSNIEVMYDSAYAGAGGYNAAAYSNPEVDRLIEAQRRTVDPAQRFELQRQMMSIVANDVPYIIFDYSSRHSALNDKYTGVAVSPAWLWNLPIYNVRAAAR
jgi:peptide/nickel transport system substrate-binding protein